MGASDRPLTPSPASPAGSPGFGETKDVAANIGFACACVASLAAAVAGVKHEWRLREAKRQGEVGRPSSSVALALREGLRSAGQISVAPSSALAVAGVTGIIALAEPKLGALARVARLFWALAGAGLAIQAAKGRILPNESFPTAAVAAAAPGRVARDGRAAADSAQHPQGTGTSLQTGTNRSSVGSGLGQEGAAIEAAQAPLSPRPSTAPRRRRGAAKR